MANKEAVWDCVVYKTVWEAERAVGFPVLVPPVLRADLTCRISVIGGKLVDITDPYDIVYRTSEGVEDISGYYGTFEEEDIFDVQGDKLYHVTAKGNNGFVFLALWNDGTYTYSFRTPYGTTKDTIECMIKSLTQVDGRGGVADADQPNPMVEYEYIFEAEYAADFGIAIPYSLGTDKVEHIYVISGKVVQLNYKNGIVYRTARGDWDISGDYVTYPYAETFEEGEFHVTAKGNEDLYNVAIWVGYGMSWSIYCPHGIHKKSLIELINSMGLVNNRKSAADNGLSAKADPGAYTTYHAVTEAELALFHETLHLYGVHYEPLLVATQVVAGKNYRFICNAEPVVLNPIPYLAQVTIFVPIPCEESRKPTVSDIRRLN